MIDMTIINEASLTKLKACEDGKHIFREIWK